MFAWGGRLTHRCCCIPSPVPVSSDKTYLPLQQGRLHNPHQLRSAEEHLRVHSAAHRADARSNIPGRLAMRSILVARFENCSQSDTTSLLLPEQHGKGQQHRCRDARLSTHRLAGSRAQSETVRTGAGVCSPHGQTLQGGFPHLPCVAFHAHAPPRGCLAEDPRMVHESVLPVR